MKLPIKLLSILLVTLTLLGCGLRGPLYMPAENPTASMDSYSINQTS